MNDEAIEEFKKLIGRSIEEVKITPDGHYMLLGTDEGEVLLRTQADCCSHTWIEDVTFPFQGLPAVILDVVNDPMAWDQPSSKDPRWERDGEGYTTDFIQFYSTTFITTKGDLKIEYRNASNGYYGGNLEIVPVLPSWNIGPLVTITRDTNINTLAGQVVEGSFLDP